MTFAESFTKPDMSWEVKCGRHGDIKVRKDAARHVNTMELRGDIDVASTDCILRVFHELGSDATPLVVDLTSTDYLDCAAVRQLLKSYREVSGSRRVTFQFKENGKARLIVRLLGLDATFGLSPGDYQTSMAKRTRV